MSRPKKKPALCKNGDERPVRAKGLCSTCYSAAYRAGKRTKKETQAARRRKEEQAVVERAGAAGALRQGRHPADREPATDFRPLTPGEIDAIVTDLAAGGGLAALEELENAGEEEAEIPEGRKKLQTYLRQFDWEFRRKIISQMLAFGMDSMQIMAAFLAEPRLRKRWIDPSADPHAMFKADFRFLRTHKPRITTGSGIDSYTEQLTVIMRLAHQTARDKEAPPTIRKDMIHLAHRLARDIALLQGTIRTLPGTGDVPTGKEESPPSGEGEEGMGDEGDPDDGPGLPHIETRYEGPNDAETEE